MLNFKNMFGNIKEEPSQMTPVALAYIGDAVFDLYIRDLLIYNGERLSKNLHSKAVKYVNANSQKKYYEKIKGILTEAELIVARRARNRRPTGVPKNSTKEEYAKATAFEAVIGYIYLCGDMTRLIYILEESIGENND